MTSAPRILVVDDEPDIEALIRQKFRREIRAGTYEFLFARDGVEALARIETDAPVDVVFSDINMPRMDGLTLLANLVDRPNSPATVMVSAYGDMKNIRAAMNGGAFDFITKPIEFDDLSATLEKCLAHVGRLKALTEATAQAQKAEATLARYFSPAVAQSLARDPAQFQTKGERREGTFLFTDLQNFLPLVENTEPRRIVDLLNAYLDGITRRIFEFNGTVLKIIGDSVYAIFGAPLDDPRHACAAVDCALAIDSFAEDFRRTQSAQGLELGQTRIGVHTGWAIIGNFGGELFFDYAAYGAAVNIASRLENANKTLGTRICVSADTVAGVPDFRGRVIGDLMLQGMDQSLRCFEPVPARVMTDDALALYAQAFDALDARRPEGRQILASLVGARDDDALAAFHLGRLLAGTWQPLIHVGKAD